MILISLISGISNNEYIRAKQTAFYGVVNVGNPSRWRFLDVRSSRESVNCHHNVNDFRARLRLAGRMELIRSRTHEPHDLTNILN